MKNIKNLDCFLETHYEIVALITLSMQSDTAKIQKRLLDVQEESGHGGLYELAKELTVKFEEKFKNTEWDGDFFDELEKFYSEEMSGDPTEKIQEAN